ncbi:hypothetical protein [Pedobacter aquatilis]
MDKEKLSFFNSKLERITEAEQYKVMIGTASDNIKLSLNFVFEN